MRDLMIPDFTPDEEKMIAQFPELRIILTEKRKEKAYIDRIEELEISLLKAEEQIILASQPIDKKKLGEATAWEVAEANNLYAIDPKTGISKSPHSSMVGTYAVKIAKDEGLHTKNNKYFHTVETVVNGLTNSNKYFTQFFFERIADELVQLPKKVISKADKSVFGKEFNYIIKS